MTSFLYLFLVQQRQSTGIPSPSTSSSFSITLSAFLRSIQDGHHPAHTLVYVLAIEMFAIEGLDEEQCGPLAGVEVGDTVLISRYPRDDGGVSGYNEDGHQQDDDRASQASGEVEGEDEIDLYVGVEAEVFCAAHNNIPESNSEHQRTVELEMDQDTQMTAYSSESGQHAADIAADFHKAERGTTG